MVAYEYYVLKEKGEGHLIGILPERRKNPKRITQKSVINWGRKLLGDNAGVNFNRFYFVRIEI